MGAYAVEWQLKDEKKGGFDMATVFDTAKYILEKLGPVSAWKLQKLCYYAQAWSIAWTDEPLFKEDFQAWANGPVCPPLYAMHRGQYVVSADDIGNGDGSSLTDDQRDTVDRVLEHYGSWEPYELREQTHSEAPWKDARGDLPEGASSIEPITKESMGEYYGSF